MVKLIVGVLIITIIYAGAITVLVIKDPAAIGAFGAALVSAVIIIMILVELIRIFK